MIDFFKLFKFITTIYFAENAYAFRWFHWFHWLHWLRWLHWLHLQRVNCRQQPTSWMACAKIVYNTRMLDGNTYCTLGVIADVNNMSNSMF